MCCVPSDEDDVSLCLCAKYYVLPSVTKMGGTTTQVYLRSEIEVPKEWSRRSSSG